MADQKTHKTKKRKLEISVVGLRYRVTLRGMKEMGAKVPLAASLTREPENDADPNAIAVYLIDKPWRNFHIGYVPREVAKEIAPLLDSGELVIDKVTVTEIDPNEARGQMTVKVEK